MVQLIWSESAIDDLNSIGEYIALDSEHAAQKFVQELIKKQISLFPILRKVAQFLKTFREITGKYSIRAIELFIEYIKKMLSFLQYIIKENYYLK